MKYGDGAVGLTFTQLEKVSRKARGVYNIYVSVVVENMHSMEISLFYV